MRYTRFRHFATGGLVALLFSSALAAGVAHPAQAQVPGGQDRVNIRLARFWRGQGQTLVDGLVGVPVRHADGLPNTIQIELVVRDSAGQALHRENWTDTISARLLEVARTRGQTEITRHVNFAVRPGRYTVSAQVLRGTQHDSARVALQGFATAPLISDALISSRIRTLGEQEQASAAEIRKGKFAIESGTRITIFPTDPTLWYYLELYPVGTQPVNEELEFSVSRAGSPTPLLRTQRTIAVNERGGVDAARLPLTGLPPGEFVLGIVAKAGERTDRRESTFTMGTLQDAPVVVTPGSTASETTLLEKYFEPVVRNDQAINQMVDALVLASPGETVPGSTAQLSTEAKRRYLARFWSRLPDPRPATPQHELLEEYIGRLDFVTREYVERDIGRAGVRTDRGRIYMKYGAPDTKQLLPMTGSRAVEVWKYTRNRGLKFAYLDETGFSNFKLVYTTDPTELSLADWAERVRDVETVRMIVSF